jgi:dimeric dUTPase (all-alpha-NTP-PPase superfamily)
MLLVENACQGMAAQVVHASRSSVISLDPATSAGQTAAIGRQGRPTPQTGQLKFSTAAGLPAGGPAPTLGSMDKLEEIFRMQDALNKRIGVNLPPASDEEKAKWILNYTRAMQQETAELIDSVPWKWWAKYQKFDEQNAKVEIVDLFHFLVSLAQTLGMTPDDVYQAYLKKNAVNHQRQESGYAMKDEADSKHI